MIYNTEMTEGSSVETLSKVFQQLNNQANNSSFVDHVQAFVF